MFRAFARMALFGALLLLGVPSSLAQQSASYKLTENVFNAAGHPAGGAVLSSASWRITPDSVGEGVAGTSLASATYRMEGGFVTAYPAPGEVRGVRVLADRRTLAWDPEKSAGVYNAVYAVAATGKTSAILASYA